jgi:hypothetical protein
VYFVVLTRQVEAEEVVAAAVHFVVRVVGGV